MAMILAAGRGERLRPLTDTLPKALVEVRGRSLLERHLMRLRAAGVSDVVINLGWLGHMITERIGSGGRFGLNVVYSPEGDNVLETGGGIFRALPMLGNAPFLVVNSDIYTDMPLPVNEIDSDCLAHLKLVPTPGYKKSGDFGLHGGRINNGEAYTYSGVTVYRPAFFTDCVPGRFSVVPMWRAAADDGKLQGSLYDGPWADIGTQERLAAVNQGS